MQSLLVFERKMFSAFVSQVQVLKVGVPHLGRNSRFEFHPKCRSHGRIVSQPLLTASIGFSLARYLSHLGFPGWLTDKESTYNAGALGCSPWGHKRVKTSLSDSATTIGVIQLACKYFFKRNCSVCRCIFGVSQEGGKFRICQHHHLEPEPLTQSCKVYILYKSRPAERSQ